MNSFRYFTLFLLTVFIIGTCKGRTPCYLDGWFGDNCQYYCHCAGGIPCDKVDGSCSSGCHEEWFGPACQYYRVGVIDNGLEWLTDVDDTTCNPDDSRSVTVELRLSTPLTWVRVVVKDPEYLDQIELKYKFPTSVSFQLCKDPKTAAVSSQSMDIHCPTNKTVQKISLSGPGVSKLCSLAISGGRNVALKQPAQQSSRFIPSDAPNSYLAKNAVDGYTSADNRLSYRRTCSHTNYTQSSGWWKVNFPYAVDFLWFQVFFGKDEASNQRISDGTLTALPETDIEGSPYSYIFTDARFAWIIPSPKINYPVSEVRVDQGKNVEVVTLCEIFIYGEVYCPGTKFGLACERDCNCAVENSSCFIHSGGCPDGCKTFFQGEDCHDCIDGKYGENCDQNCSIHCAYDNSCDQTTGACSYGCESGYTGNHCLSACPGGRYGLNCSQKCSSHCAGSHGECDNVAGTCMQGCQVGYQPPTCQHECPVGTYGQDCEMSCSGHCVSAGSDVDCKKTDGSCDLGCQPGYRGRFCSEECPVGTYGQDCEMTCSGHCLSAGSDVDCNKTDGSCDLGCQPGYRGRFCSETCTRGKFGPGCVQSCSAQCVGGDELCHHEDGTCYFGCVEDDQSLMCRGHNALQRGQSKATTITIFLGITGSVAVVLAVGFIAMAVLFRRRRKLSAQRDGTNQSLPLAAPRTNKNRPSDATSPRKRGVLTQLSLIPTSPSVTFHRNDERSKAPPLPPPRPDSNSQLDDTGTIGEYVSLVDLYDRIDDRKTDADGYEIACPATVGEESTYMRLSSGGRDESKDSVTVTNEVLTTDDRDESKDSVTVTNEVLITDDKDESKDSVTVTNEVLTTDDRDESKDSVTVTNQVLTTDDRDESKDSVTVTNEVLTTDDRDESKDSVTVTNEVLTTNDKDESKDSVTVTNEVLTTGDKDESKDSVTVTNEPQSVC